MTLDEFADAIKNFAKDNNLDMKKVKVQWVDISSPVACNLEFSLSEDRTFVTVTNFD